MPIRGSASSQTLSQRLNECIPRLRLGTSNRKSSSLPFIRAGGLGWGKTQIRQLFQTCVYTVVSKRRVRDRAGGVSQYLTNLQSAVTQG